MALSASIVRNRHGSAAYLLKLFWVLFRLPVEDRALMYNVCSLLVKPVCPRIGISAVLVLLTLAQIMGSQTGRHEKTRRIAN